MGTTYIIAISVWTSASLIRGTVFSGFGKLPGYAFHENNYGLADLSFELWKQ